jgi:L-fucose dehydrogenase
MNLHLVEKVILVTGGASGIGRAICETFVEEGAIPIMIDRNEALGLALQEDFKQKNKEALFIQTELQDSSSCQMAIEKVIEKYGKIDVLVNNAGINDGVSSDGNPEDFVKSLEKNLVHYFSMLHFAKPHLIASKGNIINISSKVATTGQGNTSGYAAAKGAVNALTREWAVELLKHGIRVNAVIPAETWTPLYESWIASFPHPAEKLHQITSKIPLENRMTTPQEIADMVVFLASARASHITGQWVYVDGGYTHLDRAIS